MNINNISFHSLVEILNICEQSTYRKTWNIQRLYEESYAWFSDNLALAKLLDLLKEKDDELEVKLYIRGDINLLKEKVTYQILSSRNKFKDFWELIEMFEYEDEILKGKLSINDKIKYSKVREFLYNLGLISVKGEAFYIIDPKWVKIIQSSSFSLEELKNLNIRNELIGNKAEEIVLSLEEKALSKFPELKNNITIRCVSEENVKAGYDIESFDKEFAELGEIQKIYIEVKAVSSSNYKFYWSRNEIKAAQELGDRYFLYLLQGISLETDQVDHIDVIKNPYLHVFKSADWLKEYELLSLRKGTE